MILGSVFGARRITLMAIGLTMSLLLGGCGGSGGATPTSVGSTSTPDSPIVASAEEPTLAPATPVATTPLATSMPSSPESAESALIQVLWPPSSSPETAIDLVAGFPISDDGYAVTRNILVTGSETLSVLLPGTDEPVTAHYVSGNECLNLAVIRLSVAGYTYLDLKALSLEDGDGVYVPQYVDTLGTYNFKHRRVKGVDLDGATVEVDAVRLVSHPADAYHYSDPILDSSGNVLGIRAGSVQTRVNRYDALMLSIGDLLDSIENLRQGENSRWIGLTSDAASAEQTGYSGIHVVGVHPGPPAAALGLDLKDQIL